MNPTLSDKLETRRIKVDGTNYTASAGSSDVTSEAIDTAGYDGVRIVTCFGAIVSGAATSQKVQQATTSGGSYSDLENTSVTVADTDDNKVTVIDVYRPRERYLKVVTARATQNSTVDSMVVELYKGRKFPITQGSTVLGQEIHNSPAEGTA